MENYTYLYDFLTTTASSEDLYLNSSLLDENMTSNDTNITTEAPSEPGLRAYTEYQIAVFINKYYLIFIVAIGLPGNIAALITLSSMRPLSSSLLYMAVLAVVDAISLIVKIAYLRLTTEDVRLGDVGCKLMFFAGTFTMHYSNWILVAMTVERFIAIWFPLKVSKWCTKRRAIIVMVIICCLLIALNAHFFWTSYETPHAFYVYDCTHYTQFQDFITNVWYYLDGAAYSIVPFFLLFICNVMIVCGIKRSNKTQRVLTNTIDKLQSSEKSKQQNQITIMLVTISIVFVVLTMPNCIFFILKDKWNYLETTYSHAQYLLLMQFVFFLSDSNHAINFYLYFLSGQKFRQKFKSLICCCRKSPKRIRFNTTISNIHSVYRKPSSYLSDNHGYNRSQSSLYDISSSPNEATPPLTSETAFSVECNSHSRNGHVGNTNLDKNEDDFI